MAPATSKPANLRADSPFRPPSWRWSKAMLLYESGRPFSRVYDDDHIITALDYLRAYDAAGDGWEEIELAERYPAISDAHQLFTDSGQAHLRYELEARLLARDATPDSVSRRTGLTVAMVAWYERLFFNVRDRIGNLSYLLHQVVGPRVYTSLGENDIDLIWKLFAIYGGTPVLDDVMNILGAGVDNHDLSQFYKKQNLNGSAKRSLVAMLTLRHRDPYVKLQLMELNAKYVEIEAQRAGSPDTGNRLLDVTKRVFDAVKIIINPAKPVKDEDIDRIPEGYGRGGAEPRAKHMMQMAAGIVPDDWETLNRATYPKPVGALAALQEVKPAADDVGNGAE